MNAFDVLMNAQKRKKKKEDVVKSADTKELKSHSDSLQGRVNAFDLLKAAAPLPPKKKSKKSDDDVSKLTLTEEKFTLNFDEKTNVWSWTWTTESNQEVPPELTEKLDEYPAPKLPQPTDPSVMTNKTLQTFLNEPSTIQKTSSTTTTTNSASTTPRVIVIKHEPDVTHKSSVNVKLSRIQNSRITLYSTYKKSKPEWPKKVSKSYYIPPALLKSMLQKNVRRCRPEAAVRIAAELIRCDWLQFIRRLPVIMLEDSFLHPLLPAVIWLMLASSSSSSSQDGSGFVPSKEHIDLCLQVVWDIAGCKYRDAPFVFIPAYKAPTQGSIAQLSPFQQALVKSLIVRAAYGGMKCDVAMLCSHAGAWTQRFLSDSRGWCSLLDTVYPNSDGGNSVGRAGMKVTISHKEVGQIRPEDVILAGVDFHCTPILDYILTESRILEAMREMGYTESDVKNAMWFFRSGVTYKVAIEPNSETEMQNNISKEQGKKMLERLWTVIEDPCDEWSVQFITKKYDFKINK